MDTHETPLNASGRTATLSRRLLGLLSAQFLGAFNDNVFKMVVSLFAVNAAAGAGGISAISAVFILPFFLFSGYAGHFADVYSKRTVLVAMKMFEIVVMGLGILALLSGHSGPMLGVLFLLALQSTFFSPAKYGILPELLPDADLSRGNGLLEMSSFLAILLGTALGGVMFAAWHDQLAVIGVILLVIALAGAFSSLTIPPVAPSGAHKTWHWNPWGEISSGLTRLYRDTTLWLTVIGISYFWFLGALLQMDILLLGKEVMNLNDVRIGLLGTCLAIGIGVGSWAAGRLSGDKVELGLVPLGSIGMGISALLLAVSAHSYLRVAFVLTLLGFSGGLFIVPLNAFLQQKSGRQEKGRLIATANFLTTGGILLASAVLWLLHDHFQLQADAIMAFCGLLTLVGTVYILRILPAFLIRFVLWLLTHTLYNVRIVGQQQVPARGPALLVCNHISFVDGLLVGACLQRFIRFLIYRPIYEKRSVHWLLRLMNAIPVQGGSPKDVLASIERAREELRQGHIVCIFAEGAISRTGNLLPFKRGFERIVKDLDVPIIPIHLDRVWGSIFSFKDGRFLWKRPQRLPYPVTVSFGAPLSSRATVATVRQTIAELGSAAVAHRRTRNDLLPLRFLKTAKGRWFHSCVADSTGRELTYGKALIGSMLLARQLRKQCTQESLVGILLPASVAGVLANIALLLAGKVPVNLNFTAGSEAMSAALQQGGIRTIITARQFLTKANIEEMPGMFFIEDAVQHVRAWRKILAAVTAFLLPSRVLQAMYRGGANPEDLATVIFSSGSTGTPKGVMLSHHNILSNLESITQVFTTGTEHRVMGILPFFHSFGFTGTLWLPLVAGGSAVYHPNPLDAKTIGALVHKYQATILISTPTFYRTYLRTCTAEDFSSLQYAIAGAEKLPADVAQAFKEKYGLDLLEGYGCTEMAPVVAVNVHDVEQKEDRQVGYKPGTVGHPLPGVTVKIVAVDSGAPLPCGHEGMLLVKGPNRMLGYLGQAEQTTEVLRDDWYITGDIACIDEDGFLRITDRLSRFSKIAGEMVPHRKVEEAIREVLGDAPCVVTAATDKQRGECLVALYTGHHLTPDELWQQLCRTKLPRLWLPKRNHVYAVEAIPLLATGKVDLKQAHALAAQRIVGAD